MSAEHAKTVTEFIDSPGPCNYGHTGGVGVQSDSRKSSAPRCGMGTAQRFFYDETVGAKGPPGPGQYTLRSGQGRQVTSDKPSLPQSSFTRADRDKSGEKVYLGKAQSLAFWGRGSPGPAVYTPQQSVGNQAISGKHRSNAPKYGFGTADRFGYINVCQRAMCAPGPGSYSV